MIGVLADEWSGVWVDAVTGVLAGVMIDVDIIVVAMIIDLDFGVSVPYVVDGVTIVAVDIWTDVMVGVDVLLELKVDLLVVVTLEFATTSSEEATPFSRTACRCCPNAVLDRARALQAWMPSDHM